MSWAAAKRPTSAISVHNFYPSCKKVKDDDVRGERRYRNSEARLFREMKNRSNLHLKFATDTPPTNGKRNIMSLEECGLLTPDRSKFAFRDGLLNVDIEENKKKEKRFRSEEKSGRKDLKQPQITQFLNITPKSSNVLTDSAKKNDSPLRPEITRKLLFHDGINEDSPEASQKTDPVIEEENKENVDGNCPKRLIHIEDDPVPLKNLGNTCYMNSIVQSLFVLKCFMSDLEETFDCSQETNEMANVLLRLYSLYCQQKKLKSAPVDDEEVSKHLSILKTCVGEKNSQFKSSMQQDAVEFLDLILGSVKEEFVDNFILNFENPVTKYFEIEFECFARCVACGSHSKLPNVSNSALYLCIPENTNNFTLQDAVSEYLKEEKTEHKCDSSECGSNEKIRFARIHRLPIILFVQLGRYSDKGIKRHEEVVVPEKLYFPKLDTNSSLKRFQHFKSLEANGTASIGELDEAEANSNSVCYQLISVICHYGNTLAGGHYVSYVFEEEKQSWYLCDDDTINESSLDKVQEGSNTCGVCFFYVNKQLCS